MASDKRYRMDTTQRLSTGCIRYVGRLSGFTLVEVVLVVAILAIVSSLVVLNVTKVQDSAEITIATTSLHTLRDAICGTAASPGYLADMKCVPGFQCMNLRVHDLFNPSSYPAFSSYDPQTTRGWRGPYLQNTQPVRNTNAERGGLFPAADERRSAGDATFLARHFYYDAMHSYYGTTNEMAMADLWGNPIVVQVPLIGAFSLPASDMKRSRYARLVSAGPDGILQTPLDGPDGRLAGMRSTGTSESRGDDLVLFLNRPDTYEQEEP